MPDLDPMRGQCRIHEKMLQELLDGQKEANERLRRMHIAVYGSEELDEKKPGIHQRLKRVELILGALLWAITIVGSLVLTFSFNKIIAFFSNVPPKVNP